MRSVFVVLLLCTQVYEKVLEINRFTVVGFLMLLLYMRIAVDDKK